MIPFTVDDVRKIMAEDKRFELQNFKLDMDEAYGPDHMVGIRDCVILLSTIRKTKAASSLHNVGVIKHSIEDLTDRYIHRGEVLVAAKMLGIKDDGTDYPYFFLHLGDLRRLQAAGFEAKRIK